MTSWLYGQLSLKNEKKGEDSNFHCATSIVVSSFKDDTSTDWSIKFLSGPWDTDGCTQDPGGTYSVRTSYLLLQTYLGLRVSPADHREQFAGLPAPRNASCCHWNVTSFPWWHLSYLAPHLCRLGDSLPNTGSHASMMTWKFSEIISSGDHDSMQS